MSEKRGAWASNIGFVLAAAGSAIGLGNIWKFPGKIGANGGGTFIVIYLLIVAFIGFSIMLAEITLGRKSQKNTVGSFNFMGKKWNFIGKMGMLVAFVILSYYSVVGGWVMKYILTYITGANFGGDTAEYFVTFISKPIEPLLWHIAFMTLTVSIVIKGVSAGIEKVSKFLMPVLFIILIAITIRSVTLPGAEQGLAFLFHFDIRSITPSMIVNALGQAFFSLSLGMGIMITYGSYVSKQDSLPKSVSMIALLDTFIALLAGFSIVCAVFATDPSLVGQGGGGFAFISLPNVFSKMPMGWVFGLLFFILLFFAALTSAMSILEGLVAYITEEFKISRPIAAIGLGTIMWVLGCGYSLSQGAISINVPWFDLANGLQMMPMGNAMEYLTDNLLMPLTALLACIFVGWVWTPKEAAKEIKIGSDFALEKAWAFSIKYVCPLAIAVILFATFVLGQSIS